MQRPTLGGARVNFDGFEARFYNGALYDNVGISEGCPTILAVERSKSE